MGEGLPAERGNRVELDGDTGGLDDRQDGLRSGVVCAVLCVRGVVDPRVCDSGGCVRVRVLCCVCVCVYVCCVYVYMCTCVVCVSGNCMVAREFIEGRAATPLSAHVRTRACSCACECVGEGVECVV